MARTRRDHSRVGHLVSTTDVPDQSVEFGFETANPLLRDHGPSLAGGPVESKSGD